MSSNDYEKLKELESRRNRAQESLDKEDFETSALSMLSIMSDGIIEMYRAISDLRHQMVTMGESLKDLDRQIYTLTTGEEIELGEGDCISKRIEPKPPEKAVDPLELAKGESESNG